MLPLRMLRRCKSLPLTASLERVANASVSTASPSASSRKVIFSGIQPTGIPHLGNYLGALKRWKELQDEASHEDTLIYSLVDLHAITVRQDPNQLRQWKTESLAMLLAIGLDPSRSIIFHQSDVPAHAELMWILSCQASTGYLGRMTQWKDKTAAHAERSDSSERLKAGLFTYPVLMAADVLLHRTSHVPVGADQTQHLEFARELAEGFNHAYGHGERVLLPPETLIGRAKRVMSLTEPTAKMSKSNSNPKSRILLTDSKEVIGKKINGAITDSLGEITYDPVQRPGVSNLLDILFYSGAESGFANQTELADDMRSLSMRQTKERVAAGVEKVVAPIRERYAEVVNDHAMLEHVAMDGAERARENAAITIRNVKQAIGIL